jgi:Asp-tRNA(Asn)/Glu-tRNA(Gln) amidotransferase A subunit family amidase
MRPAPRAAADESTACWKAGRPLSAIDGMPIGIKDLLETKDMPTQMGCEAFRGNFPKSDNAAVWALREAGAVILARPPRPNLRIPSTGDNQFLRPQRVLPVDHLWITEVLVRPCRLLPVLHREAAMSLRPPAGSTVAWS